MNVGVSSSVVVVVPPPGEVVSGWTLFDEGLRAMLGAPLKVFKDAGWIAPTLQAEVLEKAKGKARKFRGIYKGTDIGFAMHPSAGVEFYNVSMLNPGVTTDDDVVKILRQHCWSDVVSSSREWMVWLPPEINNLPSMIKKINVPSVGVASGSLNVGIPSANLNVGMPGVSVNAPLVGMSSVCLASAFLDVGLASANVNVGIPSIGAPSVGMASMEARVGMPPVGVPSASFDVGM